MLKGELRYPFRLSEALFVSLDFARVPEIPAGLDVQLEAHVRVHRDKLPDRLQVDLKVGTTEQAPVRFTVELVGLFDAIESGQQLSEEQIVEFVNERALHMLSPLVTHVVRQTTASMGVNPLRIPTPYYYAYPGEVAETLEEE